MNEQLKIAICEDLIEDSDLLQKRIKESKIRAKTICFSSGEEFLDVFLSGLYHVIFLDIYMDGMTGLQVADAIRKTDNNVQIVFTTTSQDHALEANRYRSLMYIQKPVTLENVAHCLNIAEAVRKQKKKDVITLKTSEKQQIDVPFDDIIYIEVVDHKCKVHTICKTIVLVTSTSIDDLAAQLSHPQFLHCHRSYIANLARVSHIDEKDFHMQGGGKAYIRVKDFSKMKKAYESYLFKAVRGSV